MKTAGYAGNIYMGGWSAEAKSLNAGYPSLNGSSVDAGLQYNNTVQMPNDSYGLYINLSNIGYTGSTFVNGSGNGGAFSFACGVQISNSYTIVSADNSDPQADVGLVETAVGDDRNNNNISKTAMVIFDTESSGNYNGWSIACDHCVMKYMVSIGENIPKGSSENLHDGSSFLGSWQNVNVSCGFTLYGVCNLGQSEALWDYNSTLNCTEYVNWYSAFDSGLRDCTQQPTSQGNVFYQTPFSYSGSDIQIINPLPTPSPSPTPSPTPVPTPSPTPKPITFRPTPRPTCGTRIRHCLPDDPADPDPDASLDPTASD